MQLKYTRWVRAAGGYGAFGTFEWVERLVGRAVKQPWDRALPGNCVAESSADHKQRSALLSRGTESHVLHSIYLNGVSSADRDLFFFSFNRDFSSRTNQTRTRQIRATQIGIPLNSIWIELECLHSAAAAHRLHPQLCKNSIPFKIVSFIRWIDFPFKSSFKFSKCHLLRLSAQKFVWSKKSLSAATMSCDTRDERRREKL